ncbi:MAG: hypothetical protein IPM29_20570 [Planctomycetes bacterium]|nr:hypothetical protein [Planctomycetota bacterium]
MVDSVRRASALALLLAIAACGQRAAPDGSAATAPLEFRTVAGEAVTPLGPAPGWLHCLIFVTVDCPIANNYSPEIESIVRDYADRPVRLFLVHVDPDVDAATATAHARDHGLTAALLLDPEHRLVAATGATITPEASLHDHTGAQLYRGRIDDRFGRLGSRRPEPNHRDLRAALDAALRGDPPLPDNTPAVGCQIADFR